MAYIFTLIFFILVYICIICLMKYMKNTKIYNIIFASVVFGLYAILVFKIYKDVGFNDWNFQNALPTANISPFMFFSIPLSLLLPKKIKKYYLILISLLSVGMFLSPSLGCIYNAVIKYKFHFHFLLDYVAHFALSLWGIYLIKSNQISLTKKASIISASILVGVVTLMLIVNVILDTAFFGLSLNGKHNIYNNVIVSNSYLSAVIYYLGVVVVLFTGFLFQNIINKKTLIGNGNYI